MPLKPLDFAAGSMCYRFFTVSLGYPVAAGVNSKGRTESRYLSTEPQTGQVNGSTGSMPDSGKASRGFGVGPS